eukprot:10007794-Lingulodinium_polyedra.AAC.1
MKFDDSKLQMQFQQLETELVKFDRAVGADMSDAVMIGLLISSTTGNYNDHLCLSADSMTNYDAVRQ